MTVVEPQLLAGPRSAIVLRVADRDGVWVMPADWPFAVCDVLLASVRTGRITVAVAQTLLIAAGMLVRDAHERIAGRDVLTLAAERGLTAPQAVSVLTARHTGAPLVSFDPQILSTCADVAVSADLFGAS